MNKDRSVSLPCLCYPFWPTILLFSSWQSIYSLFIVYVGKYSIRCAKPIRDKIHRHLVPPFEELFDDAEEYSLNVLFEAWAQMLASDIGTFDKVGE